MLKDIEIAQRAEQLHIREIAEKIGLSEDDIELYGKNKAKISQRAINEAKKSRTASSFW